MPATWNVIMSDSSADTPSRQRVTGTVPEFTDRLTAIWREVLRVDQIAPTDNFFDLGGHSVFAVQIIARIRAEFAVDVPVRVVFDYPSVDKLAAVLGRLMDEHDQSARPRFKLRKREMEDG
jgi:acyl carrier protein